MMITFRKLMYQNQCDDINIYLHKSYVYNMYGPITVNAGEINLGTVTFSAPYNQTFSR